MLEMVHARPMTGLTLLGYLCEEIDGVFYAYAEEEPVVQGSVHLATVADARNMVQALFVDKPETGIFSDIFVHWEKSDEPRPLAPDLIVLPEVLAPERERRSLKLWEEISSPIFVLEVLSDTTEHNDWRAKANVYQDEIRVPEYLVCDPREGRESVWGFRLEGGRYVPIRPDRSKRIRSEELKAWFGMNDEARLQVWNATGAPMPRYLDALQELREARARAAVAEARIRELEEELQRREA